MLPTFRTLRLTLRPRCRADLESCIAMDRDPEVVRYVEGPWADPPQHRAFVIARMEHLNPSGFGYWSLFSRQAGGDFLGWVLLTPLDLIGPEIEIGWRLLRSQWGQGFATEAARPVLRHALSTLRLDAVIAEIDTRNTGSRRVAEKIGMRVVDQREADGVVTVIYGVGLRFDE